MVFLKSTAVIALFISISLSCVKDHVIPEDTTLPNLETCEAVAPKGRLIYDEENEGFIYTTSGGSTIKFSEGSIIVTYNGTASVQYWGASAENRNAGTHENLNGKHIKDIFGTVRTFIFPDGTKITYKSSGDYESISSISIYDGSLTYHFNASCEKYTLVYAGDDQKITDLLDKAQPDGETSTFEITQTSVMYVNIYTEEIPDNKVMNRVELGRLYNDKPNVVDDLFDDPRLAHT